MNARLCIGLLAVFAAECARPGCDARGASAAASLRGRLSGDARLTRENGAWTGDGTLRYLPELTLERSSGPGRLLDLELSLDAFGSARSGAAEEAGVDLYRLKLRLATPRTETRIGLQQLNFGPAFLLRPLRWFDVLDPRDPLKLTEGVYALGFRYVGRTNASLWLWALYGNDEPKGYEIHPTADGEAEFGGRLQVPVPAGEAAFTFHRRTAAGPEPLIGRYSEQRFALDGRWDVEIGLWFETALARGGSPALPFEWSTMAMLGADYTFAVGGGLHVLAEHMIVAASDEPFGRGEESRLSGLSLGYVAGYVDRLSAIAFYSWDDEDFSLYAAWERTWDMLALVVSAFRYPESNGFTARHGAVFERTGAGGSITVIFNH